MEEIIRLVAVCYFGFVIFFYAYIARTKIKPIAEKYGGIDWDKLTGFEGYKLMFVGYRKICKEKGLSLLFSNIFIILNIVGIFIFFLLLFTIN